MGMDRLVSTYDASISDNIPSRCSVFLADDAICAMSHEGL